jgi:hypothetical protein
MRSSRHTRLTVLSTICCLAIGLSERVRRGRPLQMARRFRVTEGKGHDAGRPRRLSAISLRGIRPLLTDPQPGVAI